MAAILDYPINFPAKLNLIWLIGFRREDLQMFSCQNQQNL
jgi:hypothetical protein